jgi:PKD repeat protein
LACGALLLVGACSLDKKQVPALSGPAVMGLALKLTATPDVITADGNSSSLIRATVYNNNGQLVQGQQIYFATADEAGRFASIGTLSTDRETTNNQGIAQVIYTSPPRTDATANQTVLVVARPVSTDFNGQEYRSVRIELRSAEPRLFPQVPGNVSPICSFVIEAPSGFKTRTSILFQSTSSDPDGTIVRYQWFFGDGVQDTHPDENHVYLTPGDYTVTHVVTDDDGAQAACAASFVIQ